jgi:DNA-binding NtrC family response regulator
MCDVLVLHDSPYCELIAEFLEDEGFESTVAHTPDEAFNILRGPPGARVLVADEDLNQAPGAIDGFATAIAALRLYPSLRVVYIACSPDLFGGISPTRREKLLQKPFIPTELIGTVRDLLDDTLSGQVY